MLLGPVFGTGCSPVEAAAGSYPNAPPQPGTAAHTAIKYLSSAHANAGQDTLPSTQTWKRQNVSQGPEILANQEI